MARYDLGLSQEEFCHLTMRQFRLLMYRREIEWQRADYRAGILASVQANMWMGEKGTRTQPADFFAGLPRWDGKTQSITSDAANKAAIKMMMAQHKAAGQQAKKKKR